MQAKRPIRKAEIESGNSLKLAIWCDTIQQGDESTVVNLIHKKHLNLLNHLKLEDAFPSLHQVYPLLKNDMAG